MTDYLYGIDAKWRVEPTSPAALGEKFLAVLEAISNAAPPGGEWQLGKPPYLRESVTREEAHAAPADWVKENVVTEPYVDDGDLGYMLIALRFADPTTKRLKLASTVGGSVGDDLSFEVGEMLGSSDLDTVTYSLFRATLLAIVRHFPPVWANARLFLPAYQRTSTVPGVPPHPSPSYGRPWLSYLCAPLTEGLVSPVGVPCERTPDGGLLMIAAEDRLDPFNGDHMRRSRAIAEVMIARAGNPPRPGHWPLREEWPPTAEALRRRKLPPDL
jgi:hypothetical protein